jgi:hypothetical protein
MAGNTEIWPAQAVRKQFIDYFAGKGHTVGMWGSRNMCKVFDLCQQRDVVAYSLIDQGQNLHLGVIGMVQRSPLTICLHSTLFIRRPSQ